MICEDWRAQARALDQNPDKDRSNQYLYGIPVLVKDNIEVKGTPNTAGSYVLRDNISKDDSFLVKCLRDQGAVILGKCNLSEFAYWMSEDGMPSGYSSLSGQVIHPYNPSFDPSGSSSGSAVAVAARYCDLAVGTETDGSLMSPAISNGIVIDHISAGRGMKLYELLGLEKLDCSVAIIKNVHSSKLGKKDIIKIDADIPVNFDVIGYVDPGVSMKWWRLN